MRKSLQKYVYTVLTVVVIMITLAACGSAGGMEMSVYEQPARRTAWTGFSKRLSGILHHTHTSLTVLLSFQIGRAHV